MKESNSSENVSESPTQSPKKIESSPKDDKPEGYVFGRPTKYKKEYCQAIIEFTQDGSSFEEFAAEIFVSIDTLYEWAKVHPDFSEAKRIAEAQSFRWWNKQGRDGVWGGKAFNSGPWVHNMKARFGKYGFNPKTGADANGDEEPSGFDFGDDE